MNMYIDTCSYDDFDRVVRFLLEKKAPILSRDKMKMVVQADISDELFNEMTRTVQFDESISVGDSPLPG